MRSARPQVTRVFTKVYSRPRTLCAARVFHPQPVAGFTPLAQVRRSRFAPVSDATFATRFHARRPAARRRRARRLPARLPRHVRHARHRRGRPGDARARRPRSSVHATDSCARRSTATWSARIIPSALTTPLRRSGPQGQRALRAGVVGRGDRPDRRRGSPRSRASRRTARRRSCRTRTPARWACIQGASMDRRFFHRLGASLLDRTICSMAGTVGMRMTRRRQRRRRRRGGCRRATSSLLWGTNTLTSNPHLWPFVRAGARGGRARRRHRPVPHAHRRPERRVDPASAPAPTRRSRSG